MGTRRRASLARVIGAIAVASLSLAGIGVSGVSASGAGASGVGVADSAGTAGPLRSIAPDSSLNCFTDNEQSGWLQFFRNPNTRPASQSCATLISVAGIGLFGPREYGDSTGSVGGTPLLQFQPLGQRIVTPQESADGAARVITTVGLPGTGITLTQTDRYRSGETTMRTSIKLRNDGDATTQVVVYRTGDCFPMANYGFGIARRGSVGCQQAVQRGRYASPIPGPLYIRWRPTRGASHFAVGGVDAVRGAIANGGALHDTCDSCRSASDVAAALSWTKAIPAGGDTTVAHSLTMSLESGRAASSVRTEVVDADGHRSLVAYVRADHEPVAEAAVDFRVGSLTVCSVVTDSAGVASCPWNGAVPEFVATYFGDPSRQPARSTHVPSTPRPPANFVGFPACAQFDRGSPVTALGTTGLAFHALVGGWTLAPPCPGVVYRVTADGVTVGLRRGDLSTTNFTGGTVAGFVSMFLGQVTNGCYRFESIDTRTGDLVDSYPSAADWPDVCIDWVAGQKYR